jgi:alkylation response protein AidB-like acyl-CoA dehydrogenase
MSTSDRELRIEPGPLSRLENGIATLIERLRARAAAAESARRVPAESIAELQAAGFLRVYQPARFGGDELTMREVFPLVARLAEGCASTAWVAAVLHIQTWIVGLFPDDAQSEVFGPDPNALIGAVLQPRAAARRVGGGFSIEAGRWPFASGVDHGQWAILGALLPGDGGPPDTVMLLLPRSDFEILDDWHVTGLRATGSKSIVVSNAFVPAHRVLRYADAIDGTAARGRGACFHQAFVPMLSVNVTGPAVGCARRAIEVFEEHLQGRTLPFSPAPQIAAGLTHRQLASALVKVEAAELVLHRALDAIAAAARAGVQPVLRERARVRAECAYAVRLCLEAVETLYLAAGGGVLQVAHPLARLHADVHAMHLHAALNLDNNLELYGATVLDQPINTAFV